jgi:hypothetical protein
MLRFYSTSLKTLLLRLFTSSVCRADDGQDDNSDGKKGPKRYPHLFDYFQKLLKNHYPHLLLRFIGYDSEIANNAKQLDSVLTAPLIEMKLVDCLFQLGDDSLEMFEFQSTWEAGDLHRFFKSALWVADSHWNDDEDLCPSVGVTIILRGDIVRPPEWSSPTKRQRWYYPGGKFEGKGTLNFFVRLFYLNECDGIDKIVKKRWPEFERFEKEGGEFPLTKDEIFEFLLASLVMAPNVSSADAEKFLTMGRVISQKFNDWKILHLMLFGVKTLGDIITPNLFAIFKKELIDMGADEIEILDFMSDGRYSANMKELESKTSENSYLLSELQSKTSENSYLLSKLESKTSENSYLLSELESKTSEFESKTSGLLDVISRAVLALHSDGKNPEEISERINLALEEVIGVLRENGKLV